MTGNCMKGRKKEEQMMTNLGERNEQSTNGSECQDADEDKGHILRP